MYIYDAMCTFIYNRKPNENHSENYNTFRFVTTHTIRYTYIHNASIYIHPGTTGKIEYYDLIIKQ